MKSRRGKSSWYLKGRERKPEGDRKVVENKLRGEFEAGIRENARATGKFKKRTNFSNGVTKEFDRVGGSRKLGGKPRQNQGEGGNSRPTWTLRSLKT